MCRRPRRGRAAFRRPKARDRAPRSKLCCFLLFCRGPRHRFLPEARGQRQGRHLPAAGVPVRTSGSRHRPHAPRKPFLHAVRPASARAIAIRPHSRRGLRAHRRPWLRCVAYHSVPAQRAARARAGIQHTVRHPHCGARPANDRRPDHTVASGTRGAHQASRQIHRCDARVLLEILRQGGISHSPTLAMDRFASRTRFPRCSHPHHGRPDDFAHSADQYISGLCHLPHWDRSDRGRWFVQHLRRIARCFGRGALCGGGVRVCLFWSRRHRDDQGMDQIGGRSGRLRWRGFAPTGCPVL